MIRAGCGGYAGALITLALLLTLVTQSADIFVPDAGTRVPMLDIGGRPMVDVMVNGKGPYPFILDTGARTSCRSRESLSKPAARERLPANSLCSPRRSTERSNSASSR